MSARRRPAAAVATGPAAASHWRLAAATCATYVALDQISKQIVVHSLARGESARFLFGVRLTDTRNEGVAFGALAGHGGLVLALTIAALTLLVGFFAARAATPMLWLPTGVILGGALGNLADRARSGAVVDFIDPRIWPTFNIADAGIVLGVLGLLYVAEGARR